MHVLINDQDHVVEEGITLERLWFDLALPNEGIAIAVNDEISQRHQWTDRVLSPNDRVLIIKAFQGG